MIWQNLWYFELISLKNIIIFPKNFLNFTSDTIEKCNIIKLNCNRNMHYVSVVLRDSKVTFLGDGEDAAFNPFLFCVFYTQHGIIEV